MAVSSSPGAAGHHRTRLPKHHCLGLTDHCHLGLYQGPPIDSTRSAWGRREIDDSDSEEQPPEIGSLYYIMLGSPDRVASGASLDMLTGLLLIADMHAFTQTVTCTRHEDPWDCHQP